MIIIPAPYMWTESSGFVHQYDHQYGISMPVLLLQLRESASVLCVLTATWAIGFEAELRVGSGSDKLNLTWSEGTVDPVWPVCCCYSSTNKGKVALHSAAGERDWASLWMCWRNKTQQKTHCTLLSREPYFNCTSVTTPSGAATNNEETSSCTERTDFSSPLRQIDSL